MYTVIEYKWYNIHVTTSITPTSAEIKCSCLNWILWQIYLSATEKELSLQRWSEWSKKRSVVFSLLFSNLHHGYATHWHEVPSHSCSRFCMQQLSCWQARSGGAVSPLKSSAKLPQQQLLAPIYHLFLYCRSLIYCWGQKWQCKVVIW